MMNVVEPLKWSSNRVADPEGWWLWLAVDAFPDLPRAVAEARKSSDQAVVTGMERMRLRWADEDDENDAYLMDEWGINVVAEPHEDGDRAFWSINLYPDPGGVR